MDIYWIKDKRRCGPSTVPDVISLLQVGELTPETLGWHAGCQAWQPLRELPALADFLNKPTPSESAGEASTPEPGPESPTPATGEKPRPALPALPAESPGEASAREQGSLPRVYLPSPVARLLARFVDYGLYAALYGGFITMRGLSYDAALLPQVNPLLWLPLLALEAWMLSSWGTTPGKALMGIRLTTFGDAPPRLSFLRALLRSAMVFTFGMGLMFPQLLPIMLAIQFWMLRRRGITPWDARCSTLPTLKEPTAPSRYVLAVISLYISAVVFFSCMQPWLPGMIDDISRTNPEMAQTLRELMPEQSAAPTPVNEAPSPATPTAPETTLPGI